MSPNRPDADLFSALVALHAEAGVPQGPSELHGLVCGVLGGGVQPADAELQGLLAAHADLQAWPGPLVAPYQALRDQAQASFEAEGLELALLLPPEQEELGLRVAALGQWCEGFLAGFGTASAGVKDADLSPGLQEALSDLSAISQVATPDEETDEQEGLFEQVADHARMAAIMVFTELALKQRRQNPEAQASPTRH